jgi:hypothetical protein
MLNAKLKALSLALFFGISACGGGGSDGSANAEPIARPGPVVPLSLLSYENRHTDYQYFDNERMPSVDNKHAPDARAFFQYPDGSLGYIYHMLPTVGPWNGYTIDQAQPGQWHIMKQTPAGEWVSNNSKIRADSVPGCIHPRKIVAADYNQDGAVDFVIACHGWDATPYPGEKSRVVLSQGDGTYKMDYMSDTIGFQHSATAADLNGDGYPDLIVASMSNPDVFINDRTGHFVKTTSVSTIGKASHLELLDLNGDGRFDIVTSNHEWQQPTQIIFNRGDNDFSGSLFNRPESLVIPAVPGAGVITDFLYVKSINALYVLRTGGSRQGDPEYYKGVWLQKFDLTTKISTVVYSDPNYLDQFGRRGWIRWMLEKDGYVVGDYLGARLRVKIE